MSGYTNNNIPLGARWRLFHRLARVFGRKTEKQREEAGASGGRITVAIQCDQFYKLFGENGANRCRDAGDNGGDKHRPDHSVSSLERVA